MNYLLIKLRIFNSFLLRTRYAMAEISELESRIIKQIEYYFGDYNIGKDKFLQEEIKKDEGWIALSGEEWGLF